VADPRDSKLPRSDLTSMFAALARGAQRPRMAGEHATKDRRLDVAIMKRQLNVKKASEVGEHDVEAIALEVPGD
jgi:hypothetical protein